MAIDPNKTFTQDEIFLKEIELERWAIRVEEAERAYMNATSSTYITTAVVRANMRDVYRWLEKDLKMMRERVRS